MKLSLKLDQMSCSIMQGIIILLLLSFIAYQLYIMFSKKMEGFENDTSLLNTSLEIGKQIQSAKSDAEIQTLMQKMMGELIAVGAIPDTSKFVTKTELTEGQCTVSNAMDRDQYVAKSSLPPPGPRIDMSQYVKKSAIPACPDRKCPDPIDLSQYVKKSTLFREKNQPCIAPRVKVSAGLCKECPPCPTANCPACPTNPPMKCPETKPCPPAPRCPEPQPCPTLGEQPVRYDVKYIKVPTIITKTVVVDQDNNVLSQKVETANTVVPENLNNATEPMPTMAPTQAPAQAPKPLPSLASLPNTNEACLLSTNLNNSYRRSGGLSGPY